MFEEVGRHLEKVTDEKHVCKNKRTSSVSKDRPSQENGGIQPFIIFFQQF